MSRNRSNSHHHNNHKRRNPNIYQCMVCKRYHALRFCKRFLNMSVEKREETVEKFNYCVNCLARTHDLRACVSMDMCKRCDRFHHTLLHPTPHRSKKAQPVRSKQKPKHRQPTKKIKPQQPASTPPQVAPATSNNAIIIEAIKSLAAVLCADGKAA